MLFYEIGYSTSGESTSILRTFYKFEAKLIILNYTPDSQVHGANMRPILGRQDPGVPHVGPMDVIWDIDV